MHATPQPTQQLPLLPIEDEEVMRVARRLFESSRLLCERWPSFDKAIAHPSVGRCLLMNARQVLRSSSNKKKGRRR